MARPMPKGYDLDDPPCPWCFPWPCGCDWTEGPCEPMRSGCTGAPHRPDCPEHADPTPTEDEP